MTKDPVIENRPVLVVEDDDMLARIVLERLRAEGYQVQVAYNWKEASSLIEKQLPDLLIMDLNLPDADGMDIIEQLRNEERTTDLAVVVTSAMDDTDHLVRGIRSGVMFFLTKPYDLDELVRKVRSAIFQRFEMKHRSPGCEPGE